MQEEALITELKKLKTHFDTNVIRDDGASFFEIKGTVTTSELQHLSSAITSGIEFNTIKVGDVFVDFYELSKLDGQSFIARITSSFLTSKNLSIYLNWDDFLKVSTNLVNIPDSFWIVETDSIYPEADSTSDSASDSASASASDSDSASASDSASDSDSDSDSASDSASDSDSAKNNHLKGYLNLVSVIKLLKENADHIVKKGGVALKSLIFLHKTRLNIPIKVNSNLLKANYDGISIVNAVFEKDQDHKEQKASIFKEVLYSFLNGVPENERFIYLITHFGEFSTRLNENYHLFVSEFSFDDVRKEYEEKKRDYIGKLNDVYSSVIVKMLGIPIALALIANKISATVDASSFWINLFLLFAVSIYCFMMAMLIANQKHTLEAIHSEYNSHMSRLKHQYPDEYDRIIAIKLELDLRRKFQTKCLNGFNVMTAALFLLVFSYFLWSLPWKAILGI
ncbi:hypothetical protein AB6E39_21990 [Vibrio splendidus]|uniref:hypothetical protein n=1 Tax=Vibrio splendidus TaxID=29497 RepID=UPI001E613116|nr:hypothetical protein [Vibrio splendidus]MCC4790462.1 hypothetical protein [Vibrio splendidus]